jgi:hypothetical protein
MRELVVKYLSSGMSRRQFVGGPQAAAPDHAVDRGLPGAAILPAVAEHGVGVALEALGLDQVAARA